jgi:hypothetical protein
MTLNIQQTKRTEESSQQEPKRQKLSATDAQINELSKDKIGLEPHQDPAIKNLSTRVSPYQNPEENMLLLSLILEHLTLDLDTMTIIEQVSRHARTITRDIYLQIARRYGYEVQSYLKAKEVLKALFNEIRYLNEMRCFDSVIPISPPHTRHKTSIFRMMHSLSREQIITFLAPYKYLYFRKFSHIEKYGLGEGASELLSIFKWEQVWAKAKKEATPVDPEKGALAVYNAMRWKKTEIVERLLEMNAPIAACRDEDGCLCDYPLFDALYSLPMTVLFEKHKADVNATNCFGEPVLIRAICEEEESVIEFLLKQNANPNVQLVTRHL